MDRTADELLDRAAAEFKQWCAEKSDSTEEQLIHNTANHLALCLLIINSYYKANELYH